MRMRQDSYGKAWMTSANPQMRDWQEDVAWAAQEAMTRTRTPRFAGAVQVTVSFYLPRPKTVRDIYPVKKPDLDKLIRCVGDALTGVAYTDDNQVVSIAAQKRYAAFTPSTSILVTAAEG